MKWETVRNGGNDGKVGAVGSAMGDDSLELGSGRLVATVPAAWPVAQKPREKRTSHFGRMTMP